METGIISFLSVANIYKKMIKQLKKENFFIFFVRTGIHGIKGIYGILRKRIFTPIRASLRLVR